MPVPGEEHCKWRHNLWDTSRLPLPFVGGVLFILFALPAAVWDCEMLQGRDHTMTRDWNNFVSSPLQSLTFKKYSAGNSFTESVLLWTPALHLLFHPSAFQRQLVRKHTVYKRVSAYTIHPVTLLLSWGVRCFLNWSRIWSSVFIAHIGQTLICRKSLQVENLAKTHIIEWIPCCAWINEAYTVA